MSIKMNKSKIVLLFSGFIFTLLSAGCIYQPVQPWERDLLAEKEMQAVADPLEELLDDHIYFSREAAHGGGGVGGGGCGCN
jgi:hypothetical protein